MIVNAYSSLAYRNESEYTKLSVTVRIRAIDYSLIYNAVVFFFFLGSRGKFNNFGSRYSFKIEEDYVDVGSERSNFSAQLYFSWIR